MIILPRTFNYVIINSPNLIIILIKRLIKFFFRRFYEFSIKVLKLLFELIIKNNNVGKKLLLNYFY